MGCYTDTHTASLARTMPTMQTNLGSFASNNRANSTGSGALARSVPTPQTKVAWFLQAGGFADLRRILVVASQIQNSTN